MDFAVIEQGCREGNVSIRRRRRRLRRELKLRGKDQAEKAWIRAHGLDAPGALDRRDDTPSL